MNLLKGVCSLSLSIQEILKSKGITANPQTLPFLEARWEEVQALRGDLTNIPIDDADIGLRNIPGGDHVEQQTN